MSATTKALQADAMKAAARERGAGGTPSAAATNGAKEKPITTGIALQPAVWKLLIDVAGARKKERGGRGRASVSAILSELVERHRPELEAEVAASR